MTNSTTDLVALEQRLSVILSDLRAFDSVTSWQEVEVISQTLANSLRIKDGPGKEEFKVCRCRSTSDALS